MSPLHVRGLDRFVDEVHAQFDAWTEDEAIDGRIGSDGLAVLRLAAHEWIANLVQHAEFCGPAELTLALEVVDDGVRCQIEDSSRGFDFVRQISEQQSLLDAPGPSERGRGLLMLISCAEDLAFRQARDGVMQQIAFTVRAPDADMFASLFRPEDLALDESFETPGPQGDGVADALPLPIPRDSRSS